MSNISTAAAAAPIMDALATAGGDAEFYARDARGALRTAQRLALVEGDIRAAETMAGRALSAMARAARCAAMVAADADHEHAGRRAAARRAAAAVAAARAATDAMVADARAAAELASC